MRIALCIAALHVAAGLAPRLATNNKRRVAARATLQCGAARATLQAEVWDATDDTATQAKRRETFRTEIWRKRPLLVRKAVDAEALRAACDVSPRRNNSTHCTRSKVQACPGFIPTSLSLREAQ